MKRIVTKHGKKRIKERVGVRNTRYNYKQARMKGNYNYQYDGDFRKFLDYLAHKNKHKITVYNNYIYIIKNSIIWIILVTKFPINVPIISISLLIIFVYYPKVISLTLASATKLVYSKYNLL